MDTEPFHWSCWGFLNFATGDLDSNTDGEFKEENVKFIYLRRADFQLGNFVAMTSAVESYIQYVVSIYRVLTLSERDLF